MADLIFRNVEIYDGLGSDPYESDIAIERGYITRIDSSITEKSQKEIDATGLAICPGFIDIHGHSDYYLLINPSAEAKVKQGITTDVGGNCGYSAAPIHGSEFYARKSLYKEQFDLDLSFHSLKEYLQRMQEQGIALNYVPLIGHNTIRASVMGGSATPCNKKQLFEMEKLVDEAMRQGAFGLSTGLVYAPANFAESSELVSLCKIAANRGGLFATHMRSEGDSLIESIHEVLNISKEAEIPIQISHLKTAGEKNWSKLDAAFDLIEERRDIGQDVTCDRYPYIASNTHLSALLPDWAHEGLMNEKIERLKKKEIRKLLILELSEKRSKEKDWNSILISRVLTKKNKDAEGKTVLQLAKIKSKDPAEVTLDLLIEEKLNVEIIIFMMNEGNMRKIIKKDYTMIGSDAGALTHKPPLGVGKPHPRNFGTFPQVLGSLVVKEKLMTMSEAIRKMTSLPCSRLGINDRGKIDINMKADLVLFDSKKIQDKSTYQNPMVYPEGIKMVLVNGISVVEDGEYTGALPGITLKKSIL